MSPPLTTLTACVRQRRAEPDIHVLDHVTPVFRCSKRDKEFQ